MVSLLFFSAFCKNRSDTDYRGIRLGGPNAKKGWKNRFRKFIAIPNYPGIPMKFQFTLLIIRVRRKKVREIIDNGYEKLAAVDLGS